MGRGLSDLQRKILLIAYENRLAGIGLSEMSEEDVRACMGYGGIKIGDPKGADVTRGELLHRILGWEISKEKRRYWLGDTIEHHTTLRFIRNRRGLGQVFSAKDIGSEQYNTGNASLSRALTRLRSRGLIDDRWQPSLTEAGMTLAKGLTVNGRETFPQT